MRFPDDTGMKLSAIELQSSKVRIAWNTHEFVGLTKEVFELEKACVEYLSWAKGVLVQKGVIDDTSS